MQRPKRRQRSRREATCRTTQQLDALRVAIAKRFCALGAEGFLGSVKVRGIAMDARWGSGGRRAIIGRTAEDFADAVNQLVPQERDE